MEKIALVDMQKKNKLEMLIEHVLKNASPKDIDGAVYVCNVSEVTPEEILDTLNITIKYGKIYTFGPKETDLHQYISAILTNIIRDEMVLITGPKWIIGSNLFPMVNSYNCGAGQYKRPDGVIFDENDPKKTIVSVEVGFTHENLEQLTYELIHEVSEFTNCSYAVGAKINPKNELFEITFIIIQRTTEINQCKIVFLKNLLNKNVIDTNLCIQREKISSIDDITPEQFNAKVVFYKVVNDSNINEPVEFELDGNIINVPEKKIKVCIPVSKLKRFKEIWEEYKLNH